MMNYREKIRKAISCPQFGDEGYGEWGALRYDQRVLIKRLLDELDSADKFILNLCENIRELEQKLELSEKSRIENEGKIHDIDNYIKSNPLVFIGDYHYYVNDIIGMEDIGNDMCFIKTLTKILDVDKGE